MLKGIGPVGTMVGVRSKDVTTGSGDPKTVGRRSTET